ncbi:MAG: exonuclease domain-containing protein, partial [Acidimicrobiales bacterium]
VETAGPAPGRFPLLEIGACVVGSADDAFSAQLRPDRDGIDATALAVSGLSIARLKAEGTAPGEAMEAFAAWIETVAAPARPLMVGLNVAFDWLFVAEYFDRYLGRNPFGHAPLDIKALAMGVDAVPWAETSWARLSARYGAGRALAHSAVEDARDQAVVAEALLSRLAERRRTGTHGR